MRTVLIAFVFFCFLVPSARGFTSKGDSLLKLIEKEKRDSALSYLCDAFAREISDMDPDSSLIYAKRSLFHAEKVHILQYQADALNTMGMIHRIQGKFEEALDAHFKALDLSKKNKLDSHYTEETYSYLVLAYTEQGNYTAGIECGYKLLNLIEGKEDTLHVARVYNNLADAFFQTKEYGKAMKNYRKAYVIAKQMNHLYGQGLLASNIGCVFYETNELDSAKYYFDLSLDISKQMEDESGEAYCYSNLGSYYHKKGEDKPAIEYYNLAKAIYEKQGLMPNVSTAYYNLATSYLKLGNYAASLENAKKALAVAEQIKSIPHQEDAHLALKNVYEKMNNIPKAFFHFKEYISARDSIYNEENRKDQYKSEINYEYEKRKMTDSLEQVRLTQIQLDELEREKLRTQSQRRLTYGFSAGFMLALVLVLVIYKGFRDKKKAHGIITAQKNQVEIQKNEIENQKHILEVKNREIIDSISYAKHLQEAILPPLRSFTAQFPDSFVLYRPKDIVSGDFYWMEVVSTGAGGKVQKENGTVLFAVGDCTGHGVPGAMVSVVCANALNQAVKEFHISEPGKILDKVRSLVIETFEKSESEVKDGMDVALGAWRMKEDNWQLEFAGANNPLWMIRRGGAVVEEVKGNSQPIGMTINPAPFTTHTIELQKGDCIYIFSDGFSDQFGGEKGKKLKASNLKKLLLEARDRPMEGQRDFLSKWFEGWKGNLEQLDDVCIIGIRF